MVDPFEFLNDYTEWHDLWAAIFIGFLGGFAAGIWIRHRMRRFVHDDVVRPLASLGAIPGVVAPDGVRLDHYRMKGTDTKLAIPTQAIAVEVRGGGR